MTAIKLTNMKPRERLLAVAEEAFFTEGFDAVSVRSLTEAAGVNLALVNYHFGGKRNLYLEVLRRRFSRVAAAKCDSLRQTLNKQTHPDLRDILGAYILVHLGDDEQVAATQNFLRLVARQLAEDNVAMELLLRELVLPIHQLLKETIAGVRPDMSAEKISLCISSVTGQIFHFIRCPETARILAGLPDGANLRACISAHILDFSLHGMQQEAPCTHIP